PPFPRAAFSQGVISPRHGAGHRGRCKMKPMGFYLWVDEQLAWAQGTYEYRKDRSFRAPRFPRAPPAAPAAHGPLRRAVRQPGAFESAPAEFAQALRR